MSAFGGIIAFNSMLDEETAKAVVQQFVEVIIAPTVSIEAKEVLLQKPNIRVFESEKKANTANLSLGKVSGWLLVQTHDSDIVTRSQLKFPTLKKPSEKQIDDLLFAWKVAKFVKSNAVVFAGAGATLAIGAGQMSRVDSAKIAVQKAGISGINLKNSVAASDAFFPFSDALDIIIDAGVRSVIQPGGSVRDNEIIEVANDNNISMVFTGQRHFRH